MHEKETTASIKRYISGHYTANPWKFRKLLIWIIAFVDNFIASFVSQSVPSNFHRFCSPLQFNLLRPGMFLQFALLYFQDLSPSVGDLLTPYLDIIIKNTNIVYCKTFCLRGGLAWR